MPKVTVINQLGQQVGDIELNNEIFDVEINEHVVYEVVKNQLANKRQGTQCVKNRSDVRGGGKKPWRQKGTGRARQGSIRSPQWKGGGVVFAAKPRDYSYSVPKKVRRLALKSVLTSKVRDEEMIVLEDLKLEAINTKAAKEVLNNIKAAKKVLVVTSDNDTTIYKSFRNLPNVATLSADNINVYDVINNDSFVVTKEALKKIEEVFA